MLDRTSGFADNYVNKTIYTSQEFSSKRLWNCLEPFRNPAIEKNLVDICSVNENRCLDNVNYFDFLYLDIFYVVF